MQKMFYEGQRDLVFPRVPGHEVVAASAETGEQFTVWPGESCGRCELCLSGRENLCAEIKIMGFHFDGGYSDLISVSEQNMLPLKGLKNPALGTFAEPMGCLVNIFTHIDPFADSDIIIYGGGTLGLMAAFYAFKLGIRAVIIEKDEEKIALITPALKLADAAAVKETPDSDFAAAINTCADNAALGAAVTKVRKGGKLLYFSGVKKNENISTNLLNLIHYRELKIFGSYGLSRLHMSLALDFIKENEIFFKSLVTDTIPFERLGEIMPDVISGKNLKYIAAAGRSLKKPRTEHSPQEIVCDAPETQTGENSESLITGCIKSIRPVSESAERAARAKIDNKAKPLGGFGKIEDLAVKISAIQNNLNPVLEHKMMLVFAADHGITEEGVSAYPQEVTRKMLETFLNGKAAINILCKTYGIEHRIIDMGVNYSFGRQIKSHPLFIDRKIRMGSRNMALEPAMTPEEAKLAVQYGMDVFFTLHNEKPVDILGLGEVGIGNTSSASAVICAAAGKDAESVTGRGAGLDDKTYRHKIDTLIKVLNFQKPNPVDGFDILQKVGGYEIAAMAGAALAASSRQIPVMLDGLISTAAGIIAYLINPVSADYFIIGHKSVEPGHRTAADFLGQEGLIDLSMRLGEGTGAAFGIDLCTAACNVMCGMAGFDEAGIDMEE